jgi:hypothetical protein
MTKHLECVNEKACKRLIDEGIIGEECPYRGVLGCYKTNNSVWDVCDGNMTINVKDNKIEF